MSGRSVKGGGVYWEEEWMIDVKRETDRFLVAQWMIGNKKHKWRRWKAYEIGPRKKPEIEVNKVLKLGAEQKITYN